MLNKPVTTTSAPSPDRMSAVGDFRGLVDLRDEDVFDRSPNGTFDRLTRLAERLLDVPIALVVLKHRGHHRLAGSRELPPGLADRRSTSPMGMLLDATTEHGDELLVTDTREIEEFRDRVTGTGLAAFAGHPLVASTGETIGVLCAVADEPRLWTAADRQLLGDLAAVAGAETELHARAGRLAEVAAQLGMIADPLEATEDAVSSLANIADRAGDPRVERLASLARERLRTLRSDTASLRGDLAGITGRDATGTSAAVNLAVRILRAVRLVEAGVPDVDLQVDVRHRPLTVAGDGLVLERGLVRLLAAVAAQAGTTPVQIVLDREDAMVTLRLRWSHAVPVPELARLASLANAVRTGDEGGNASLSTLGGRTTTSLADGEAATGPQGTDVVARMPLRTAPDSGAAAPDPSPEAFPWGN